MFSIQELVTATEQRLALPVVIVDNGGYAEIREQMVDRGIDRRRSTCTGPTSPALARAVGAHGVVAEHADDLGRLAAQGARGGPAYPHPPRRGLTTAAVTLAT